MTESQCGKCCTAGVQKTVTVVKERIRSLRREDFSEGSRKEIMLEQMINHQLKFGQNDRVETSDGEKKHMQRQAGYLGMIRKSAMSRTGCIMGTAQDTVLKCMIGLNTEVFCKPIYRVWTWN